MFGRRKRRSDEPAGVGRRQVDAGRGARLRSGHPAAQRRCWAPACGSSICPVPFELYSDGIDLPVFEEFGAGTAALHLRDQLERNELLADTGVPPRFRREFDRIKLGPSLWHRDFHDAVIVECPDESLIGKSFGADRRRARAAPARRVPRCARRERRTQRAVDDHRRQPPAQAARRARRRASVHMGFSDAGAHLRNMAFYNFPLRLLKRVRDAEPGRHAVHDASSMRCTG